MPDSESERFDLAIVGAGSGGMAAARRARSHGLSVVLFEPAKVGGTCVNRGCVPKKLLVTASRQGDAIRGSEAFGWSTGESRFDWARLRDAVRRQTDAIAERQAGSLEDEGVTLVRRRVRLAGGGRLVADDDGAGAADGPSEWRARDIVLATGSRPLVPELPGAELALVSDDLFGLDALPGRLALIGGGYIAIEFANMMSRFGVEVSVFESGERVLEGFDDDVVSCLGDAMGDAGIEIVTGCKVSGIERGDGATLSLAIDGAGDRGGFDAVALVVGRAPNVEGIGLEAAGVELDDDGMIRVDGHFRTSAEHVRAIGDAAGAGLQLTPVAIEQGRCCVDAILGREFSTTRTEHVPTAAYSTPECGAVGLTEARAEELGIAHEVRRAHFSPLDDTLSDEPRKVLVKLVVEPVTGRLLGFHSFGANAAEATQMAALPITAGMCEEELHRTLALHPTHAEEIVSLGRPDRPARPRPDD